MYINCCDDTEGEYEKRINHLKKIPKKKTIRRIKTKKQKEQKTQELKGKEHNASNINQDRKLLFICLFLFTFTGGVMNPWDQIREARPYHERDSSSKADFNTQANQCKRKAIFCELNAH